MERDDQKQIDEAWKETIQKEKAAQDTGKIPPYEDPTFATLMSSLGIQSLVFLGELPDPATGKKEKNLEQAKFVIDMLAMLREKTKGNLTAEETPLLEDLLYDLRMKYVTIVNRKL